MYLPLRMKFLIVAAGVAVAALGSSLWAVSYQLESRMAAQIAAMLSGAESTFKTWKGEQEKHLQAEARIVAHDPRFFAAVAEGDQATAEPTAREFQDMAGSDLFLVCDRKGRRLAHLGTRGSSITLDWPSTLPPKEQSVRWDGKLYLTRSQAVVVGPDTIGYVALGLRVDENLAQTMGRVAGADVLFFDGTGIFGTTLSKSQALEYVRELKNRGTGADSAEPHIIDVASERILCRVGQLNPAEEASYAVSMSLDQRLEPQIADLRATVLWVGSLALLFAFAVSWSVANRVTRRVPQLVAAVEAVSHGDYDLEVRHEGHDELRAVADAVDRMRHELAAQMEAISKANAEKISSERLAVVGKMSSTIIHDFKTPMQVIRTAVELSSGPDIRQEKREHYAQMILRELDRMVHMAQDLLSFARGERRMNRTAVDLTEFMALAIGAWRQICEPKGIRVDFASALSNQHISIDQIRIRRALDNIVINATEVLTPGGVIAITCGREDNQIAIAITDNGPGIPAEIRDHIFEPFATFGKEAGSGLGLAMARKAVEDHGGTIRLVSSPSSGTTFTLLLPAGLQDENTRTNAQGVHEHVTTSA